MPDIYARGVPLLKLANFLYSLRTQCSHSGLSVAIRIQGVSFLRQSGRSSNYLYVLS